MTDEGTIDTSVSKRWASLAVLLCGVLLIVMDQTITAVVLPHISRDLSIGVESASLSITVFMIAAAAAVTVMGQVADIVGRRRVVMIGFLAFAAGSVITALADDLLTLLIGRAVQGFVFAALTPAIMGLVNVMFPSGSARTLAFALWSTVTASAVAIGPLLGGAFASFSSWRYAFLINIPICMAIALGARLAIAQDAARDGNLSFDPWGIVILALMMAAVVLSFQEGTNLGWWTAETDVAIGPLSPVPLLVLFGVALAVALAVVEGRRAKAGRVVLLEPAILAVRSFRISLLGSASMSMALYGLMIMLPIYLQFVLGVGPFQAGVALFVLGAGMVCGGLMSAGLVSRFGKRPVALWCLAIQVLLLGAMVPLVSASGSPYTLAFPLFPYGCAYTIAFSAFMNALLGDVPTALSSRASGISSTLRLGFDAVSTALMVGLMIGLTVASTSRIIADTPALTAADRTTLEAMTHYRMGAGAAKTEDLSVLKALSENKQTASVVTTLREGFVTAGRGGLLAAIVFNIFALVIAVRLPAAPKSAEASA
ncbi:MAG: MFS transporter [Devosia sp.]